MKKNELKRQLRIEASKFVPDNKEQIMQKLSIDKPVKSLRRPLTNSFKFSLAFSIILVAIIGIIALTTPTNTNSLLMIEINPTFELELDKEDNIVDIRGLNLDAVLVLESLEDSSWDDLSSEEAIEKLIDLSINLGYLDTTNNTINLTAINTNSKRETKAANLYKTRLENIIKAKPFIIKIKNNNEDKEYQELAREYKISSGRVNLIKKAMEVDNTLTINEAKKKTIKELNEIIKQNIDNGKKAFKDYYDRQIKSFRTYYQRITKELNTYHNNYQILIKLLEALIVNYNIPINQIESQIENILEYLHMDDYQFIPEDEEDKHAYYEKVLDDIKEYAEVYFDELETYIEEALKERNTRLKRDIKDRIKANPNDYTFEFEFNDDLEDLIIERNTNKKNGKKN